MYRLAPALLLTACAAANSPLACRITPVATIPIRMAGTIPSLEVQINGRPARLLLDTGAEATVIAAGSFDRLGLERDFTHAAYSVGLGARMADWLTKPVPTVIGTLALPAAPLVVTSFGWREMRGTHPDGVLGSTVLSGYDVDLDMPRGRLTLYARRDCPDGAPPFAGPSMTIAATNNRAYKLEIPIAVDGAALMAEIDTGASRTLVEAGRVGLADTGLTGDREVHLDTADPVGMDIRLHRFAQLQVGTEVVEHPLLAASQTHEPGFDALLGSDYWRTRRLWISYGGRVVTIGPPQPRPR